MQTLLEATSRETLKTPTSTPATDIPRFNEIQDLVKFHYPDADIGLIQSAYVFSAKAHKGHTRRSGEPYLVHPVAVAKILAKMKLDEASIAAGLLHDTVEDTLATLEEIEDYFGSEIAELVDGVTKMSKMEFQSKEQRKAESFRKMILAFCKDLRVLMVKLADRLHNMRTLHFLEPEARKRIAGETLDVYAQLADRLGIHWMFIELADLSLKYFEPETYESLAQRIVEAVRRKEAFVAEVLRTIEEKLRQYRISAVLKNRIKTVYSVYRKMQVQKLEFDQIHDLVAFRIIVNDDNQCYVVLGLIHELWKPFPGRFKDYIATPKSNGYKSLHTTVLGPGGNRIEIQIRTHGMDLAAEEGIAAHWSYKLDKPPDPRDARAINWLRRQVMDWQQDMEDPRDFADNVRVDLYPNEVYVFTPKGDVREFPRGSTPLDFAYSVHTQVGHSCVGARINGRMVPLKYQLRTGDVVEIITSAHQKPSKDWLKLVKTARAKAKIRRYVMEAERERAMLMGKESAERELRRWRLDLTQAEKEGDIFLIAEEFGLKTVEDLYVSIGYGKISPKVIVTKLVPQQERETAKAALHAEKHVKKDPSLKRSGVKMEGLSDLMVNFAKCCNPLPGDRIRGFITRGRGVTVHTADCENIADLDPKRCVDVEWDQEQSAPRVVTLGITASYKSEVLAHISTVFSSYNAEISKIIVSTANSDESMGKFTISVRDVSHLERIMTSIRNIKGVRKVERLRI